MAGVIGRLVHAGHAAEPLAEDGSAGGRAPSAQGFAGGGEIGLTPEATEDVVIGEIEIEVARGLILFLPAALNEADALVIEGFELVDGEAAGVGGGSESRGIGSRKTNGGGGFKEIAAGDVGHRRLL